MDLGQIIASISGLLPQEPRENTDSISGIKELLYQDKLYGAIRRELQLLIRHYLEGI